MERIDGIWLWYIRKINLVGNVNTDYNFTQLRNDCGNYYGCYYENASIIAAVITSIETLPFVTT